MQGTLIALAAFSQWQLLDKVKSAGLLSPVAYLSRITSPLARDAVDNFLSEVRIHSHAVFVIMLNTLWHSISAFYCNNSFSIGQDSISSNLVGKRASLFTMILVPEKLTYQPALTQTLKWNNYFCSLWEIRISRTTMCLITLLEKPKP